MRYCTDACGKLDFLKTNNFICCLDCDNVEKCKDVCRSDWGSCGGNTRKNFHAKIIKALLSVPPDKVRKILKVCGGDEEFCVRDLVCETIGENCESSCRLNLDGECVVDMLACCVPLEYESPEKRFTRRICRWILKEQIKRQEGEDKKGERKKGD